MADRDLPFDAKSPQPSAKERLTPLGLIREVLSKSDMFVRVMALTFFFTCIVGAMFAYINDTVWGFAIFFPAAISVLVWAVRRDRSG
ncbi:hypothetical protein [Micromonospora sp. NBS 11-29]|uniref:hypothetical protein n=1 Tax=Micromonospora sp. NBS 11-29 TaxID=1960879 RepID=UPI000B78574B|nr:hypothetical protein [Micromonospora sp. NBS 11-29]